MSDTIVVPRRISRRFISEHPSYTFVYGGAYNGGERTFMGQGAAANGFPNTYLIPTKFRCCRSDSSAFFHDGKFFLTKELIDRCFERIPKDKGPIIVFPSIGRGAANLQERAPKTLEYINTLLNTIQYPHIWWDNASEKYA